MQAIIHLNQLLAVVAHMTSQHTILTKTQQNIQQFHSSDFAKLEQTEYTCLDKHNNNAYRLHITILNSLWFISKHVLSQYSLGQACLGCGYYLLASLQQHMYGRNTRCLTIFKSEHVPISVYNLAQPGEGLGTLQRNTLIRSQQLLNFITCQWYH